MRALATLIAGLWLALPCAARADVVSAVNWARLHGCPASGTRLPLRDNSKLQKAALRLASGAALHDALSAVGYAAAESSALHFSGAASDSQIAGMLTADYCRTLTDPALREVGAERGGRDVWMVLAAPVTSLKASDAVPVSRRILGLVNAARASGRRCGAQYFAPVAPLTLDASLTRAALAHSEEMARYAAFDHRGHDGSTPAQRVERSGYAAHRIVGENIAVGAMSPAEVTAGWLASPAHCENIMDGRFTQIGIAYTASPNPEVGLYWTQDFAAPR